MKKFIHQNFLSIRYNIFIKWNIKCAKCVHIIFLEHFLYREIEKTSTGSCLVYLCIRQWQTPRARKYLLPPLLRPRSLSVIV
jgi:hypothetical protein